MPTPINAELYVPAFAPTGVPGEYSFDSAIFNNQADTTGSGTYDVQVGHALYVAATSVSTGMPILGVFHRYKLTQVTQVDLSTLSGVMIWDEDGSEEDQPTSGVFCLLAETTPNKKLGLVPSDAVYPSMIPGSTQGALRVDVKSILDKSSGSSTLPFEHFEFNNVEDWVVTHGRGTKSFSAILRDAAGNRFYAGEHVIDNNSFVVHCSEPTTGSIDVFFSV